MDDIEVDFRSRIQDGGHAHAPPPLDAQGLLALAQRRRTRRRATTGVLATCVLAGAALILTHVVPSRTSGMTAAPTPTDTNAGGLSASERTFALSIVEQQAAELGISVTDAFARVSGGTVEQSNTGQKCTSGSLLMVQILGNSDIVHTTLPGKAYEDVQGVVITADPDTEVICAISATSSSTPLSGSTALLDE